MIKSLVFLCLSTLVIACGGKVATTQEVGDVSDGSVAVLTEAQFKAALISTDTLKKRSMARKIKLNGFVEVPPQSLVSVSAPLGGFVKTLKLVPGMYVKKDDIIATVEDLQFIQLQQDYLTAQSKWRFAEIELDRQKQLLHHEAGSDKALQQVQSEVDLQRITMMALAEKLRLIHINPQQVSESNMTRVAAIKSPITGLVTQVHANVGKFLSPSDLIYSMMNPNDIYLALRVFEKDVSLLAFNQKITAYSNANPAKKYQGTVSLFSGVMQSDGTSTVHCRIINPDKEIRPGLYMNAELEVENPTVDVVPEKSVVSFEGKDYLVVEDKRLQYRLVEVETGFRQGGFATVLNAQQFENRSIVANGAYTILMKMKNKEE
jgi:cobalt-zinc-cadmium efflux system membrane fusion protein